MKTNKSTGFTAMELVAVVAVMTIIVTIILPILSTIRESGKRAKCVNNLKQLGNAIFMYVADYNGYLPPSVAWNTAEEWDKGYVWDWVISPYLMTLATNPATGRPTLECASEMYLCPTYVSQHQEYINAPPPHNPDGIQRTYAMNGSIDVSTTPTRNYSLDVCPGFNYETHPQCWPYMDKIIRPANTILLTHVFRTLYKGIRLEQAVAVRTSADVINYPINIEYDTHRGGNTYLFFDGHVSWMSESNSGQWHNG